MKFSIMIALWRTAFIETMHPWDQLKTALYKGAHKISRCKIEEPMYTITTVPEKNSTSFTLLQMADIFFKSLFFQERQKNLYPFFFPLVHMYTTSH